MKKKFMLILISFILLTNLFGCNLKQAQQQSNDIITYEELDKLEVNKGIEILSNWQRDDGSIITYEKGTEYGIMKLYRDESTDEIGYIKESLDISNYPNEVVYLQISDSKENHIALFILDEDIRQRAKDIAVEFKDKESTNKPYMISETTNKRKAIVISYISHGELRDIKRIIIWDENYNDIYTK